MRILLVDNDRVYLGLLSEILHLHAYDVITAEDGEAALEILQNESIDLIISDISMPKINGMNLHRYVRRDDRLKNIPFAWNSGYRELRDAAEPVNKAIDFTLEKGIPVPRMLSFVSKVESSLHREPSHVLEH